MSGLEGLFSLETGRLQFMAVAHETSLAQITLWVVKENCLCWDWWHFFSLETGRLHFMAETHETSLVRIGGMGYVENCNRDTNI